MPTPGNIIKVKVKKHYGVERYYVIGEHEKAIKSLTKKTTIDVYDMDALAKLGFKFDMQHNLENDQVRLLVQNLNERMN